MGIYFRLFMPVSYYLTSWFQMSLPTERLCRTILICNYHLWLSMIICYSSSHRGSRLYIDGSSPQQMVHRLYSVVYCTWENPSPSTSTRHHPNTTRRFFSFYLRVAACVFLSAFNFCWEGKITFRVAGASYLRSGSNALSSPDTSA